MYWKWSHVDLSQNVRITRIKNLKTAKCPKMLNNYYWFQMRPQNTMRKHLDIIA